MNHAVPVADTPLELPAQLGESEFTGEPAAQAQAASASRKQLPGFLVPMAGLALFALTAIASAGTVLLTRHGTSYPLDLADADYDLESMTLRQADLPAGIHLVQSQGFNNDEWAQVVGQDDPAAKKRQLDAQGRVRSFVAYFTWDDPSGHLGKTISVTAESDLFINEPDAKAGASGLCASLVGGADPPVEFAVSGLGDQSSGFFVTEIQQNFGRSVDTVVCFRTGRIVHGVIETGLEGTQKVAVAVRLAQRMLQHVDETFSGHPVPKELPPIQAPSTPPPSQSPSSGPSPKPSP